MRPERGHPERRPRIPQICSVGSSCWNVADIVHNANENIIMVVMLRKSLIFATHVFGYRSKYDEIHKKLRLCALSVRTTNACIAILQTEVAESNNDKRVLSAYQSLVHIYMDLMNVDKMWLQLFRESFEFVISDRTIREHAKTFSKYLKILKFLKDSDALLASSIDMLALYPDEYVPLDMMCWLYVERFKDPDASYEVCRMDCRQKSVDTLNNPLISLICPFQEFRTQLHRHVCR